VKRVWVWRVCGLLGAALALWRGPEAWFNWSQWNEWKILDPSAADLYITSFWFEMVPVTLGVAIALVAVRLGRGNR
jgi:hypothetical protein